MRGGGIITEGGAPAPAGSSQGLATAQRGYSLGWRRARLVIRKIDPWSVLKFSLLFNFCLLLIMLLGSAIIFAILKSFGVIANIEKLIRDLSTSTFNVSGGSIFRWLFLFGLL